MTMVQILSWRALWPPSITSRTPYSAQGNQSAPPYVFRAFLVATFFGCAAGFFAALDFEAGAALAFTAGLAATFFELALPTLRGLGATSAAAEANASARGAKALSA